MTSFSFGITFETLADKLKERLAAQPQKGGVIEIEARGHRHIIIAQADPGGQLAPSYEETAAGLIVTRGDYSVLIPYWDIFGVSSHVFTPLTDK